jgi:hypothetical protein
MELPPDAKGTVAMRFLVKCEMPVEASNEAIADPEFGRKMEMVLKEVKAEAAYFTAVNGCRGGYIIVNMDDPSQIPAIAEPFFLWLNAKLEFTPVMTPADLAKAGPAIEAAVKKWRRSGKK